MDDRPETRRGERTPARCDVRITGIEPLAIGGNGRNLVFCVADTDEGVTGIGEAGLTLTPFSRYMVPSETPIPVFHSAVVHFYTGRRRDQAVPKTRRRADSSR